MTTSNHDFAFSTAPEPHRLRTKQLLKSHPEIAEMIGSNPATPWWTGATRGRQGAWARCAARLGGRRRRRVPRRRVRGPRAVRRDPGDGAAARVQAEASEYP